MAFYCFYQTDSQGVWHLALASERNNLVKTKGAKLITALDVDNDFSETLTSAQVADLKQIGDLFFDFDAELPESIENFKRFLVSLQGKGVELNQCRIYATGGRGFHFFIPMAMYMTNSPKNGVTGLVHIYKEMAFNLYSEGMDIRIYSSKKGRQLRCANVLRDNGLYKVQITPEEALAMTVDRYKQVCGSPRNPIPVDPPAFNPDLGLLYSTSRDKVDKAIIKQKKAKPQSLNLQKFGGEWPETLLLILNNLAVKPDVGWNYISMQLAIAASNLGKSEEQLLTDAAPLIEGHSGDSDRYGSPRKRREDLRQMYRYVNGSPCYEFSVGGVLALLIPEVRPNADIAQGEFVPDDEDTKPKQPRTEQREVEQEDGTVVVETVVLDPDPQLEEEDDSREPVKVSRHGIYTRSETGFVRVSACGISDPMIVKSMKEGTFLGFIVDVFVDSKPQGRHMLQMDRLVSKASFLKWTMTWGTSMSASDNQTSRVTDVLRRKAEKSKSVTYVTVREGLDLVVPPGSKGPEDFDILWASGSRVVSRRNMNYIMRCQMAEQGFYKSDLLEAPFVTVDDHAIVRKILNMNTTRNLALMVGWFSACFLCQPIRKLFGQFPSMQVFGQAGAGKSTTVEVLTMLHYYLTKPKILGSSSNTPFAILTALTSSASIPVVFDEFKIREMQKHTKDLMHNAFRSNYNGHGVARGSLSKDTADKGPVVNEYDNVAPIVFIGEAIDDQAAILERCVMVALSKTDQQTQVDVNLMKSEGHLIGRVGKQLMSTAMSIDMDKLKEDILTNCNVMRGMLRTRGVAENEMPNRPIYNQAVVLVGIGLMKHALQKVFGNEFDDRLEEMAASVIENLDGNMPKNVSEASRVLDTMAMLSHSLDTNHSVVHGIDYLRSDDGRYVDLKMKQAYAKYVKYNRDLGYEVLFDSENAFIVAMGKYQGTVSRAVRGSPLADSPMTVIFRFDCGQLEKEGLEMFA